MGRREPFSIMYIYVFIFVCTWSLWQSDAGWEEYWDYIFPDDEGAQPNLKLLAMAKQWASAAKDEDKDEDTTADKDNDDDDDDDESSSSSSSSSDSDSDSDEEGEKSEWKLYHFMWTSSRGVIIFIIKHKYSIQHLYHTVLGRAGLPVFS